ncbi:MAG: HYR domain-containing protein [Saprospiraceae bacterium]|nr:HYR domain-containing protein [Saprospiraceae bacterium]
MNNSTFSHWVYRALPLSIFLFFYAILSAQTQQATLVKDINVGAASSNPTNFTSVGNIAYFTANDGSGSALWKSDGTATGTVKIGSFIGNPQGYNGLLYYTTTFRTVNPDYDNAVLWSYNGTTSTIVDTIKTSYGRISNTKLSLIGSKLAIEVDFYPSYSPSETNNIQFLSSGTRGTIKQGGSVFVRNGGCGYYSYTNTYLADTLAFYDYSLYTCGVPSFNALHTVKKGQILQIPSLNVVYKSIFSLGTIGNRLIFIAPIVSTFPFTTFTFNVYSTGVDGDTVVLSSNLPISLNSPPFGQSNKIDFNQKIYFTDSNNKIWETNGTSSGTIPLTDGTNNTLPLSMNNPIVLADGLYFYDGYNNEFRIWKIGTTGNIRKILSIPNTTDKSIKLANFNNELWQFATVNTSVVTERPVFLYKIDVVNGVRQSIAAANGLDYENGNYTVAGLKIFAAASDSSATNTNPKGQELFQLSIDPSVANCANDNVVPYFGYCPASTVKNITTDRDTAWYPYPTALDNCSTPSVTANITGFYANNAVQTGNTVIISKDSTARFEYTATDAKGNTSKCIFTVKVVKVCVPASSTFTTACPTNMTVSTADACTRITWQVPTAVDNCGNSATVTQTSGAPSGSCFAVGTSTIAYSKQYGGSCSFTVTVNSLTNSCRYNDSLELVNLFNATYGNTSWAASVRWNLSTPINTWYGVMLNADGCVQRITLNNIGLSGTLPNLNLPNLQYIALNTNRLSGTIPNFNLPNLQLLDLSYNQFSGTIPNFNSLPNLRELYLNVNSLTGAIPDFNYLNLNVLSLFSNQLSGCIPVALKVLCGKLVDISNNPNLATQDFSAFCNLNTGACVPQGANCVSKSNAPWNEWIANVTFANLNNASSKTRDDRFVVGYSDWTDKTATVSRSQTYPLSITPGLSWAGYQTNLFFRAWIDFNSNSIYEDSELVLEKNSFSAAVNQSITIPATAVLGTVKMRISMKKDAYPTACETFAAGEVEDYSIAITNGTNPCATDVTPPVFFSCPSNITQVITGTTAIIIWAAPNVTDNCTTIPSLSSNYNSGSTFPIGTTTVIYTARDAANNSATCSFTVTVANEPCASDVTPPTLVNVPPSVTVNCWGNIPTVIHPTATDNCSAVSQITVNFQETRTGLTLKRTWTATDGRGNTSAATQNITVLDNIAPVFTGCPQNISVTTTGVCEPVPWNAPASVSDNCGAPDVVYTPNIGTCFPIGTHTVTYTATDGAGNKGTCSFTITVNGTNTGTCKKYTASSTNSICNPATWQPYFLRIGTDRYVAETVEFKETSAGTATLKGTLRSPTWQAVPIDLTFSSRTTTGTPQKINCLTPSVSTANWAYYPTVSGTIGLPIGTVTINTLSNALQIGTGANTQDVTTLGGYAKLTSGATTMDLAFKLSNETAMACETGSNSCTNTALNFDGINDYLQTPQYLIAANSNFTIEASFTSTATTVGCSGNFKRLLSLELSNSSNRLEIGDCGGQLTLFYFIANGNAKLLNIAGATNLRDGNWHHVAAVKNGDMLTIYYDGVAVLTEAGLQNINNVARELYVGRWAGGGDEYWQGNVDEVRVWNYAVNATDITNRRSCQLAGTETGLILYFPFNQGVGGGSNTTITTAVDKSPSNLATPLSNFGLQGTTSNFICSTQNLSQGCTTVDPCANDTQAPVFVNCPTNINLTTTTTAAVATWTTPTATDNCTTPSLTSTHTSGQSFPIGTTAVIYTAKDAKNNAATCSFNIIVTNNTFAAADIELSINATPTTYRQWTTNTVRVTAKNIGTTTLTNIKIELKRPDKMAFGGTKTPSVGAFNDYCSGGIECSEWVIPSLAAGATATLDAPFFVLDAVAPIVATTRLLSSTPTDGNVSNNTTSVSIAPAASAAQSVSLKPTQLIPVVIQSLAPNPTEGELRILLESLDSREVTFELYNALGKTVKTETKAIEKGLNRIELSVFDLEQGIYFITPLTKQGRKVPIKFVKM